MADKQIRMNICSACYAKGLQDFDRDHVKYRLTSQSACDACKPRTLVFGGLDESGLRFTLDKNLDPLSFTVAELFALQKEQAHAHFEIFDDKPDLFCETFFTADELAWFETNYTTPNLVNTATKTAVLANTNVRDVLLKRYPNTVFFNSTRDLRIRINEDRKSSHRHELHNYLTVSDDNEDGSDIVRHDLATNVRMVMVHWLSDRLTDEPLT